MSWFIHAFSPLVSHRANQPADLKPCWCIRRHLSAGRTRPGSQPTWSCWLPADLLMFLSSIGSVPWLTRPGQATTEIPYPHLSLFLYLDYKKGNQNCAGQFRCLMKSITICPLYVVFLKLDVMGPYLVLMFGAFFMLISKNPNNSHWLVRFWEKEEMKTETCNVESERNSS